MGRGGRPLTGVALGLAAAAAAALVAVVPAAAYFGAAGSGAASVHVASLAAPGGVSASAAGATVTVSWTGVARPGGGTFGYYVRRTVVGSGTTATACASSPVLLLSATTCHDTSVAPGTYTYRVVAVFNSWTAQSAASSQVVVAPSKLAVTTTPSGGANGAVWSTQPAVSVEDASGNVVTTATTSVTLAIASQPGSGATLSCTANPKAAAAGVATFAGCAITGATGTYTLRATATGLTAATSASFTITAGPPSKLAVTTTPSGGANGAVWSTQPAVSVEDASGNVVTTATTSVTLAIASQPGSGATLSCTANPKAAAAGVATFAGCAITGATGTYTLRATATGLTAATSASFGA